MRTFTLLTALLITAAGCTQAERLAREAMSTSGMPTNGSSPSTDGWPPTPTSTPVDVTGTWDTDWGMMTLRQHEDGRVTGTYDDGASTIDAVNDANTIDGYWVQRSSTRECDSSRNGSRHWGRVEFVLVERNRWLGKYGHCNDPIGASNAGWNARR